MTQVFPSVRVGQVSHQVDWYGLEKMDVWSKKEGVLDSGRKARVGRSTLKAKQVKEGKEKERFDGKEGNQDQGGCSAVHGKESRGRNVPVLRSVSKRETEGESMESPISHVPCPRLCLFPAHPAFLRMCRYFVQSRIPIHGTSRLPCRYLCPPSVPSR